MSSFFYILLIILGSILFPSWSLAQQNSQTCAVVMNHQDHTVIQFCEDQVSISRIQLAINYAQVNGLPRVQLTPGRFVIRSSQVASTPSPLRTGIFLPSNITLTGSRDFAYPSILTVDSNFSGRLDTMIYVSGSLTNPYISARNSALDFLYINGDPQNLDYLEDLNQSKLTTAVWVNYADSGMQISNLKIKNIQRSGLILGNVLVYAQNAILPGTAIIFPFSGSAQNWAKVIYNSISNVGGDGIGVTGHFVEIRSNRVDRARTPSVSNGITLFSNSFNVIIEDNVITNSQTGIGLDGSAPIYIDLLKITQGLIYNSQDNCYWKNGSCIYVSILAAEEIDRASQDNESGFVAWVTVRRNQIIHNQAGIVLWRSKRITIAENSITGNADCLNGLLINESQTNFVIGNHFKNCSSAILLAGDGHSPYGSSFNAIGLYEYLKDEWAYYKNNYNVQNKISVSKSIRGKVDSNTIYD